MDENLLPFFHKTLELINSISDSNTWKKIIESEYSDYNLSSNLDDVKFYLTEVIYNLESYSTYIKENE